MHIHPYYMYIMLTPTLILHYTNTTCIHIQLVRSGAARERGDEYADKAEDFIVQMGKVRVRVYNVVCI